MLQTVLYESAANQMTRDLQYSIFHNQVKKIVNIKKEKPSAQADPIKVQEMIELVKPLRERLVFYDP